MSTQTKSPVYKTTDGRHEYLVNGTIKLELPRGGLLEATKVGDAISRSHDILLRLSQFDVDISALLGMRNLSAFVGEIFAASMVKSNDNLFRKNPHQDGYPDLLLMDKRGSKAWDDLKDRWRDKKPFSPFLTGGIEIKATCGSVPTPKQCALLRIQKPDIGDQRIGVMRGYDWKAHHQETNYLMGIVWDFIERRPHIVGVFYSSVLTSADWGKIVQPKEGGGRTTSVSIMTREAVRKMCRSWVVVINDKRYIDFFSKHNGVTLT